MTWILILALYSPGGDLVESRSFLYYDYQECLHKSKTWRGRDAMGLERRGYCISRKIT
jgi:hypothetical protein